MKYLQLYLVGYFILLVGAAWALWQSGMMEEIPAVWIGIGVIIAVGAGIMMAVSSGKPSVTTKE